MINKHAESIIRLATAAVRDFRTSENPDIEASVEVDVRLSGKADSDPHVEATVLVSSQNVHVGDEEILIPCNAAGLSSLRMIIKSLAASYSVKLSLRPYQGVLPNKSASYADLLELRKNYFAELVDENFMSASASDGEITINVSYDLSKRKVRPKGTLIMMADSIMKQFNVQGVVTGDDLSECVDLIGERIGEVLDGIVSEQSESESAEVATRHAITSPYEANDLADEYWAALLFEMRDARWAQEKHAKALAKMARAA